MEARHRAWMRQAQARQTDLEATAAQLAAALAEAKRGSPSDAAEVRGAVLVRYGAVRCGFGGAVRFGVSLLLPLGSRLVLGFWVFGFGGAVRCGEVR